jgi:hypothetical protein
MVCNTNARCGHHVISSHIKGSYPAATLQLLCGYLVPVEVAVHNLDNLNLSKFCWIKCTVYFTTHNDSGASNSVPV